MASETNIEWSDKVWNPVTGCDRVTPGCAHCYAMTMAKRIKAQEQGRAAKAEREGKAAPRARYQRDGDPKTSGPGFGVTLHHDLLDRPRRWRKPRRIFVNSMSDLFHPEVPYDFIDDVLATVAMAPQHTFQVLTKRPERMLDYFATGKVRQRIANRCYGINQYTNKGRQIMSGAAWPLPNLWLGVSIENRRFVERADVLRDVPAAVRFISAEPLLGPLIFDGVEYQRHDELAPEPMAAEHWADGFEGPELDLTGIDWVIVGGESGPDHRPMDLDWVRALHWMATDEGTAFFFKQLGGTRPGTDLDDLPPDLRVREFPAKT